MASGIAGRVNLGVVHNIEIATTIAGVEELQAPRRAVGRDLGELVHRLLAGEEVSLDYQLEMNRQLNKFFRKLPLRHQAKADPCESKRCKRVIVRKGGRKMEEKKPIRLVIVTGLSGAGKTQAIRCLEDLGFFCVDNLPPLLIPKITELCQQSGGKVKRVALVMDVRGTRFFGSLDEELRKLSQLGIKYEILFLEASDAVLVRRYKESRRQHPLEEDRSVLEAISAERERLQELRGSANIILDTTEMTVHDLKKSINEIFEDLDNGTRFSITMISFGYKYGIPLDADLVMDVRFLPNPHYVEELKYHTGLDDSVIEYLFSHKETKDFLNLYSGLLGFLMPFYIREGKTHLVVAIGCTGGQHRSVALAECLAAGLRSNYQVQVHHRDLPRARVEEIL